MKKVSIIITTKNEEKNIENCLISISEQTYKDIELIVVDNNSDDKTKDIAKKYTNNVFNKGPERSYQRNFGMLEIASGDFLMYIDADMVLSKYLVESCVNKIETTCNCIALYISEIVLGSKFWCKVRRFERNFYDATVIDSARFYKKDTFIEVGGFDVNIDFGEEWDIDKKIKKYGNIDLLEKSIEKDFKNWKLKNFIESKGIKKLENVIYHDESDFKIKEYIKKKTKYANGFQKYINKWSYKDKDLKKQFGVKYRFFQVYLENNKWKILLRKPFLMAGMYYLRFRVGISFLIRKRV